MALPPSDRSLPLRRTDDDASEARALLERAVALQAAARSGASQPVLRGKNLGLVCDDADSAAATLVRRAATTLGAHVAVLRPDLDLHSSADEVRRTARLLGRLYDAIACIALDATLVQSIRAHAQVPVFADLGGDAGPTGPLVRALDPTMSDADRRCLAIQAVLQHTLT